MSSTPAMLKTQFDSNFIYKEGSIVDLSFIGKILYLDGKFQSRTELGSFLRSSQIITNPEFFIKDNIHYLKNYEFVGIEPKQTSTQPQYYHQPSQYSQLPIEYPPKVQYQTLDDVSSSYRQPHRQSSRRKSSHVNDEDDYQSAKGSFISTSIMTDVTHLRKDVNGLASTIQTHADTSYKHLKKQEELTRRLEKACNAQDHLDWLSTLNFDELPTQTKKLLLSKLLHSDLPATHKLATDVLKEQDNRDHHILLVVDGVKNDSELENRSLWTNSNRKDYRFQMHDETPIFFGSSKTVHDKTKSDIHISSHLKK
jgi:hypothetical protein